MLTWVQSSAPTPLENVLKHKILPGLLSCLPQSMEMKYSWVVVMQLHSC